MRASKNHEDAAQRRVKFSVPLSANCVSVDGVSDEDCLVLSVWDRGARLQLNRHPELAEFFLVFTSSVKPVYRRCKRVWMRGEEVEVEYQSNPASFVLQEEADVPAATLDLCA